MRLLECFLILLASIATVQAACDDVADGFASLNGGTTGGKGGTVVIARTQEDLEKYAGQKGKFIIKIPGKITIKPKGKEVKVVDDKTIIGSSAAAEIYQGGFNMKGTKNVIIRNMKIGNTFVQGDYEGKTQDFDGVQMDGASNVWIDHVHFLRGGDGLVDSRKDTTFLTVSYTIFENHNKVFGIGWTDNVTAEITIHHCYFHNTNQRNPSADNIKHAHLYNNYLHNVTTVGHYARGKTSMRMENVYFEKVKDAIKRDKTASLKASGNQFVSCSGKHAENSGNAFEASKFYKYKLDPTKDVPKIVKSQAGVKADICT